MIEIEIETSQREFLLYDSVPCDTIIKASLGYGARGEYFDFAAVYRGKIVAFGNEQGNYAGGITTSYKSGGLENEIAHYKERMPEFYNELKKYDVAPKDFRIDNPDLQKRLEQIRAQDEQRQNMFRKEMLLHGLEIAKFVLENELKELKNNS